MSFLSKKLTKTLIFFGALSVVVGVIHLSFPQELYNSKPCAFCNPEVLSTHTFYEDEYVRGLCSYKPIQPCHCLVVIKRHIERFEEANEKEIEAVGRLIKKINVAVQKINGPSSYLILQKNGPDVGQTVPHVHVHYIPKQESLDKRVPRFGILWGFVTSPFCRPMSKEKLAQSVSLMKKEFQSMEPAITN